MYTFRDGKSNYLEGLMLIALYIVLGLACKYFVPSADIELTLYNRVSSLGLITAAPLEYQSCRSGHVSPYLSVPVYTGHPICRSKVATSPQKQEGETDNRTNLISQLKASISLVPMSKVRKHPVPHLYCSYEASILCMDRGRRALYYVVVVFDDKVPYKWRFYWRQ
jgi:hypothetical protein